MRSSGWTLALAAVGGGLAYAFGVNQTGRDSRFPSVGRVGAHAAPRYATQHQLEKVKTTNELICVRVTLILTLRSGRAGAATGARGRCHHD